MAPQQLAVVLRANVAQGDILRLHAAGYKDLTVGQNLTIQLQLSITAMVQQVEQQQTQATHMAQQKP